MRNELAVLIAIGYAPVLLAFAIGPKGGLVRVDVNQIKKMFT